MYEKLNFLAGTTAPTYDTNGQFMRGTLTTITIGDYLSKQNGFISSVNLTWETAYPWEIDLDNEKLAKVPHVLNVSVEFTPIHDFNPKSDLDQTQEVYFGPTQQTEPDPVVEDEKKHTTETREVEYFYTSGMTYTIDKKTRKVIEVNGQPTKYTNGGFAYEEDGRQAVITKVDGANSSIFEDEEGNAIPVDDNGEPIFNIATENLQEVVITASKPESGTSSSATEVVNTDSQSPAVLKNTVIESTEESENAQGEAPTTKTTVTQTTAGALGRWKKVDEEILTLGTIPAKTQVIIIYEDSITGKKVKGSAIGDDRYLNITKQRADMKALNKAVSAVSN